MAGQTSLLFNADVAFDMNSLQSKLAKVGELAGKVKPITIETNLGTKDVQNEKQANAVLQGIRNQATAIDSVNVKQKNFTDITGRALSYVTQMTVKWKDANGNVFTEVKKIKDALQGLPKDAVFSGTSRGDLRIGAQAKEVTKAFQDREKAFDQMDKKATEWSNRAESMAKKEKEGIQGTASALKLKIEAYKNAMSSGQIEQANKLAVAIQKENIELEKNIALSKRAATAVRGWADNIKNAIMMTVSYSASIGIVRAAQQLMNEALQFTISLNKEMTKVQVLQVEGAQTSNEIRSLALAYNALGKEMGATTLEVAQGSVEWLRQGKTIQETATLLRSSTMLSKLGALDSAAATEYLTSTLNSYNMEATEAESVVNRLIAVDNVAATSTRELATALQYSAATASAAGVSLEQLVSYVGVVSSTTRQNAESIGQGFKTIFTRMQDIKAGKIDEDGLGLNNVESALTRVGVKLRSSRTEFRDMGGVLEELAGKWSTLNDIEQANISKAVAGIRQANMFKILMGNMTDALKLQEVQYNSAGLAVDRYGIYLESVEGSQNKAKASLEGLFLSLGQFDKFIAGFYKGTSVILDFITAIGGIPQVITLVITAIAFLKQAELASFLATSASTIITKVIPAFIAWATATWGNVTAFVALAGTVNTASGAISLFNAALATSGIGLVVIAIGALVAGSIWLAGSVDRATSSVTKMNDALEQSANKLKRAKAEQIDAVSAYKEFANISKEAREAGGVSNLSLEKQKEFYDIQYKLYELVPQLNVSYDEQGNLLIDQATTLAQINDLKKQEALDAKQQMEADAEKAINAQLKLKEELLKKVNIQKKGGRSGLTVSDEERAESEKALSTMYKDMKANYNKMGSDAKIAFIQGLRETGETDLLNILFESVNKGAGRGRSEGRNIASELDAGMQELDFVGFSKEMSDTKDNFDKLTSAVEQYGNSSTEAYEAIAPLLKDGKQLTDYLLEDGSINMQQLRADTDGSIESLRAYIEESTLLVDTEKAAMLSLLDSTRQSIAEYDAFGYKLSQGQFMKLAEEQSAAIWKVVTDSGNASITVGNETMYSAEAIFASIKSHPENLMIIIDQLKNLALNGFAEVNIAARNSAATMAGAFGVMPSIGTLFKPASGGGGGGGGGGKSEEQTRLEKQIQRLNDKKKALQDQIEEFKRYIDLQKDLLKAEKAEADFADSLLKKNQSLAKLKSEIAILALDDSEEAKAQRLKLEEDAANLTVEIAQDQEDRTYDLKMEALDRAQKDFEDKIKKQMDGIDGTIAKYENQKKAIDSAGGAVGGVSAATQTLGIMTEEAGKKISDAFSQTLKLSNENKKALDGEIQKWIDKKGSIEEAYIALWDYANLLQQTNAMGGYAGMANANMSAQQEQWRGRGSGANYGGTRHEGGFAGDVASNEIFHKLLKGEYVATEGDMKNFLGKVLPRLTSTPSVTNTGSKGDVSISMPINVAGSLDKTVIPDIKKIADNVIKEINKSMGERGYNRRADAFSI